MKILTKRIYIQAFDASFRMILSYSTVTCIVKDESKLY